MKKCFKCGEEKELNEFYTHPKMADRHLGKCKKCARKEANENRAKNLEKCREYDRFRYETQPKRKEAILKYRKTEKGKLTLNSGQRKWAKNNLEKKWANNLLERALIKGLIKRGNCEICGTTKKTHGHHDNYYYPLSVRWLCPQCHADHHKKLRNEKRFNHK